MKRDRILLITSALQFALFIPLAWWAHKHKQPPVEISLSRLVQRKQRSPVRSVVLVVNTLTGSSVLLNLLVAPVAAILWTSRLRLEAIVTLVSCWTGALVRTVIKQVVHRPRPRSPFVRVTKQSKGKSFPSGHVASAVNLWGWLFALGLLVKQHRLPGRRSPDGPCCPVRGIYRSRSRLPWRSLGYRCAGWIPIRRRLARPDTVFIPSLARARHTDPSSRANAA